MGELEKECLIDLLGGSMEELGEIARRMHEVQGTGMVESLALGTLGKVYCCRQPAGVQIQPLFPSLSPYFSTSSIL